MSDIIDFKELAKRLGVHKNRVYKFKEQGMPHIVLGQKLLRVDYDEVLKWLETKTVRIENEE